MTNDAFETLVDGPIGDYVWCNADPECDCTACSAVRALIAHARECREALRAVLDDDVSCVPEVGQCEYTWTVGEFCGSKTVPGTYLCERHAGQERGAAHGSYEIHRAARRCLGGGT